MIKRQRDPCCDVGKDSQYEVMCVCRGLCEVFLLSFLLSYFCSFLRHKAYLLFHFDVKYDMKFEYECDANVRRSNDSKCDTKYDT